MLDEILPLLIPMQEGTKSITSRPLAPAPSSATSSASYLASTSAPSSSSLKRPIRSQNSTPIHSQPRVLVQTSQSDPHLHSLQNVQDVHSQVPAKVTSLQSSLLSNQIIGGHPQQPQKIQVQIPTLHSLSHPCIQNSPSTTLATSSDIQSFNSADLSHCRCQNLLQNDQITQQDTTSTSASDFLTHAIASSSSPARLVAVNNMSMGCKDSNSADIQSSDFSVHQVPILSQVYPSCGTTASTSTSLPVTTYLTSTLTAATSHENRVTPSLPSPSISVNVSWCSMLISNHVSPGVAAVDIMCHFKYACQHLLTFSSVEHRYQQLLM